MYQMALPHRWEKLTMKLRSRKNQFIVRQGVEARKARDKGMEVRR